jgi:hypothetical protein
MRIIADYCTLYGKEYLRESILSINDFVDKIVIFYAAKPSFGFETHFPCPETEDEIKEVAFGASNKIEWIPVGAGSEGQHREMIFEHTIGYDTLLHIDADEVWDRDSLIGCLEQVRRGTAWRYDIVGMMHFWKSFNHFCADANGIARIFNLRNDRKTYKEKPFQHVKENSQTLYGKMYHFGYAQKRETIEYKLAIHGHKNDLKPNWLTEVYDKWTPERRNLHPTPYDLWPLAYPFDKNQLPDILKQHPNFNKEVI